MYRVELNTKTLFKRKCNYLRETIEEITSQFVKNEQDIEDDFWIKTGDFLELDPDDLEYHQEYLQELLEKHRHLPQILYKSIIVSIYSLLETTLNDIIKTIESEVPKKIKFKHLRTKGSEIENIINFVELVHEIDFGEIKKHLNLLKPYADLRNNIVHKNGHLRNENEQRIKNIEKFVSKDNSVKIQDDELFFTNNLILFRFLEIIEKFGFKFFELTIIE